MIMKRIYSGYDRDSGSITHTDRTANIMSNSQHNPNVRKARNRWWNIPMVWLLLALSCETTIKFWVNQLHPDDRGVDLCIWSGALKPIVFFYVSSKAQDGKERGGFSLMSQNMIIFTRAFRVKSLMILCLSLSRSLWKRHSYISIIPGGINRFKSYHHGTLHNIVLRCRRVSLILFFWHFHRLTKFI